MPRRDGYLTLSETAALLQSTADKLRRSEAAERASASASAMLTLSEAATLLGVSSGTLGNQVRSGKLHAIKRGRDWVVSEAEVRRYGRENRREPHAPEP